MEEENSPAIFELFKLVQWNHTTKILNMLRKHPSPSIPINSKFHGMTVLHEACRKGNFKVVTAFVEYGASVEIKDTTTGKAPLHYACMVGNKDIVYLLLKKGAFANVKDLKGQSAAHYAAAGGHLLTLRLLKKFLGKLDERNDFNNTPLHRAAAQNHVGVTKYLLEDIKANLESPNVDMQRPLHFAVSQGHLEVSAFLMKKGADCEASVPCQNDSRPLHIAVRKNHEPITRLLLNSGKVDVNSEDGSKMTSLHMAVQSKNVSVMKLLICSGAEVDSRTGIGMKTPLHLAAATGFVEGMEILVEAGANVNATSIEDRTPLHYASIVGSSAGVSLLLKHRAKRSIMDVNGKRADQLASNKDTRKTFSNRSENTWPSWLEVDTTISTGNVRLINDRTPPKELNLFPKLESMVVAVSSPLCQFSGDINSSDMENSLLSPLGKRKLSSAFENDGNSFDLSKFKKGTRKRLSSKLGKHKSKENRRPGFNQLKRSKSVGSNMLVNASKRGFTNKSLSNKNANQQSKQVSAFLAMMDAQKQLNGTDDANYEYYMDYYKSLITQDSSMMATERKREPKKWDAYFHNFKSLGSPTQKRKSLIV